MSKVMVCIKRVVDYNVRVRVKPDGSGVITDGVKMSINPFDEIALEEALRMRDRDAATEVLAVEVPDRPGGLASVLEVFENSGINIEYMYAFTFGRNDRAVLIFRFDQPDAAIDRLRAAGVAVLAGIQ